MADLLAKRQGRRQEMNDDDRRSALDSIERYATTLTGLATASLVLSITFLDSLDRGEARGFLYGSWVTFGASMLLGISTHGGVISAFVDRSKPVRKGSIEIRSLLQTLAVLIGATLLAVFAVQNLDAPATDKATSSSTTSSTLRPLSDNSLTDPRVARRTLDAAGTPIDIRHARTLTNTFPEGSRCVGLRQVLSVDVGIIDCEAVDGTGGTFAVVLENVGEGYTSIGIYNLTKTEGTSVRAFQVRSAPAFVVNTGAPGELEPDYFSVTAEATVVDGFPFVLLSYEEAFVDGPVTSYDIITWEESEPEPSVAAHLGGIEGTILEVRKNDLLIRNNNYSDGSPACCPALGDRRFIQRVAPSRWVERVETAPYCEVFPEYQDSDHCNEGRS